MKFQFVFAAFWLLPAIAFGNFNAEAFTVQKEHITHYEIVDQSASCTVVKIVTKEGRVLWNVLAGIATQFIPEAVQAICTSAGGSSDNCEVVYQASSALVSLGGKGIFKGITKGVRWVAKRLGYSGVKNSVAVEAKSYQAAGLFKNVFDAYSDAGCMKYEAPTVSSGSNPDFTTGYFREKDSYSSSQSDVYLIGWSAYYITYTGVLKLDASGSGTFRVVYEDPDCRCTKMVEQDMWMQFTGYGISIRGSNPVDVSTGYAANYSPDSFYLTMDYLGNMNVTVTDQAQVSASAWMQWVSDYSERRTWLRKFGM